jgi:hypothetical protein
VVDATTLAVSATRAVDFVITWHGALLADFPLILVVADQTTVEVVRVSLFARCTKHGSTLRDGLCRQSKATRRVSVKVLDHHAIVILGTCDPVSPSDRAVIMLLALWGSVKAVSTAVYLVLEAVDTYYRASVMKTVKGEFRDRGEDEQKKRVSRLDEERRKWVPNHGGEGVKVSAFIVQR